DGFGDELDLVDQPEFDRGDAHLAGKGRGGGEGEFHLDISLTFVVLVMAGLDPAIHVVLRRAIKTWMPRTSSAKPRFALLPGHDDVVVASGALRRDDLLALLAEALDAERDDIADIEELRRLHAGADAGRGACRDDVAGQQGEELRDVGDTLGHG